MQQETRRREYFEWASQFKTSEKKPIETIKKKPYRKVIVSGDVIEVYTMEHEPVNPHDYDKMDDFASHLEDTSLLGYSKQTGSINLSERSEAVRKMRGNMKLEMERKQQEKEDRKEERRAQTLRDARNRCRRYAIANFEPSDCFITLTYADLMDDVKQADKDFKSFIRAFRKYTGVNLKYLGVREFQKRGAIHFHFVTDWKHPSHHVDDEEYIKRLERIVGEIWGHGFVDIKPMNKAKTKNKKYNGKPIDNIGAYLTKYMTKELTDERLKSHKAYLNSKGLIKPYEYKGEEAEALIKAYELDIKKEIFTNSYGSEYLGKITYFEYNLKRMKEQMQTA